MRWLWPLGVSSFITVKMTWLPQYLVTDSFVSQPFHSFHHNSSNLSEYQLTVEQQCPLLSMVRFDQPGYLWMHSSLLKQGNLGASQKDCNIIQYTFNSFLHFLQTAESLAFLADWSQTRLALSRIAQCWTVPTWQVAWSAPLWINRSKSDTSKWNCLDKR